MTGCLTGARCFTCARCGKSLKQASIGGVVCVVCVREKARLTLRLQIWKLGDYVRVLFDLCLCATMGEAGGGESVS